MVDALKTEFQPVMYSSVHHSLTVQTETATLQFKNGSFTCKSQKDLDLMEDFLENAKPHIRNKIFRIDMDAANAIAREHQVAQAVAGAVNSGGSIIGKETLKAEMQAQGVDVDSDAAQAVIAAADPVAALPEGVKGDESTMRTEAVDLKPQSEIPANPVALKNTATPESVFKLKVGG